MTKTSSGIAIRSLCNNASYTTVIVCSAVVYRPLRVQSTVAGALEEALHKLGVSTYLLDGDNVRHGLCSDLGFSDADRKENIRRVGEVANLMVEAGLVVLTAFISPHRAERQMVRERVGEGRFIEVFVDTPLAICEARDPKGLYKKARAGELRYFTGIDSVYEAPESAENSSQW